MFIRTKKVGDRTYHQLVENRREDGRHRQIVVAHLGKHHTPEAALEAAKEKLQALQTSKLFDQAHDYERTAEKAARVLRNTNGGYGAGLEAYHEGEIPTLEEAARLAGEAEEAPYTDKIDEAVMDRWGLTIYLREQRQRTPEQVAYCEGFKDGEWRENWDGRPTKHGHMFTHSGYSGFKHYLREYHHWKARANKKIEEYNRKHDRLKERIAKLEGVVTKA